MQTQISVFQFQAAQNVRVEIKNGEPWFCLKDVAEILEIRDTKSKNFNLKEGGVERIPLIDNLGRKQEATFINEPNLYRVIFRSNKAEAVKFQDWIFEEVIPEIRRSGSYTGYLKISPAQKQQIQQAVEARHHRTGEHWQSIYRKLHQFCRVNSYHEIAAAQFEAAMQFLAATPDTPARAETQKPLRNLQGAVINSLYCAEFIYQHRAAIRGLNRRLAATLHDHAADGIMFLRNVAEQAGISVPDNEYFQYFPWDGDSAEKARYHQLNA